MTTQQDYGGDIESVVEKIRQQEQADQQAAAATPASEQTTTTPAIDTEATATTTDPVAATAAAAPAPAEQNGDVRGALRASRRSERQAREEAARLKAELEEARKQILVAAEADLTDAELTELEQDMPTVAKAFKALRAKAATASAAPPPAADPPAPEFVPPLQPANVQDVIDEVPDLLAMQHDPDQSAFVLAVKTDELLRGHPKWADKPLAERLAECARRVKAELGEPAASAPAPQAPAPKPAPASKPRTAAAAAVENAARAQPMTLSDIAGGAAPTNEAPGIKQFMKMSDEDILSALRTHG